jgi:hypothetical protein
MTMYRAKALIYQAVQWTGDIEAVRVLFPDATTAAKDQTHCLVPVPPNETHFSVPLGYWITIDQYGAMNYMPDESFQALYEEIG